GSPPWAPGRSASAPSGWAVSAPSALTLSSAEIPSALRRTTPPRRPTRRPSALRPCPSTARTRPGSRPRRPPPRPCSHWTCARVARGGLPALLRRRTDDAARLAGGEPALAEPEPEMAREPASLTVTAGFGPGLMERAERPVPDWLAPLPAFGIDALEEQWCGG